MPIPGNSVVVLTRETGWRDYPVPQLVITGTATGSAQSFLTAGTYGTTRLVEAHVRNTTATAATLTMHAIPSGDSIGDANEIIPLLTVPAQATLRIDGLIGGAWNIGTEIKVFSGTGSALMIWATARVTE